MNLLLTIVLVLACVHLAYEMIVAPSLRLVLKFKLFALRDRARYAQRAATTDAEKAAACLITEGLDRTMLGLRRLSLAAVVRASDAYSNNEAIRNEVDFEIGFIDSHGSSELKSIHREANNVFIMAAAVGSGGLMFYMVPAVLMIVFFGRLMQAAQTFFFADDGLDWTGGGRLTAA